MMKFRLWITLMMMLGCVLDFKFFSLSENALAIEPTSTSVGDSLVRDYFRLQTEQLSNVAFAEISTLDDWQSLRDEYNRQLLEMLGLDPLPEKTTLHPEVVGTVQGDGIVVERLHFQSLPGLYVTANLYRPTVQDGPLPAILYVCGHARVKEDGVSLGNKTHYQHHGAWFARNGYVCLVVDTIQLGEIEGVHHGTYSQGRWWWNCRGYTPAGVEAWNCVRALDYLQSRSEVDGERIGMTGRSGGGAYSWWTAAIDERVKVVVPVAGITNLKNHVVDGCVEGHCDCMFMVNTYRWDYALVAAMVAPRPLLISNTDKDSIFPLDGVVDVHTKVRHIYGLYQASDKLGLNITEGPHHDTQDLRISAFRWFNRFLKDDTSLVTTQATPFFEKSLLKVFEQIPSDERVTTIDESFVPEAKQRSSTDTDLDSDAVLMKTLSEKVFRGWPSGDAVEPMNVQTVAESTQSDRSIRVLQYTSQSPYRLSVYLVGPSTTTDAKSLSMIVLAQPEWERVTRGLAIAAPNFLSRQSSDHDTWKSIHENSRDRLIAYIVPRGVGPTEWTRDTKERTHIRRRFMLLGQTVAAMQVFDVCRAIECLRHQDEMKVLPFDLSGAGDAAAWSLFASLYSSPIRNLTLTDLPQEHRGAPDLLNISRYSTMSDIQQLATNRVQRFTINKNDGQ